MRALQLRTYHRAIFVLFNCLKLRYTGENEGNTEG